MTISQTTSDYYLVREYVKGLLVSFYVPAKTDREAFAAGAIRIEEIKGMDNAEFQKYVVPGEFKKSKVTKIVND